MAEISFTDWSGDGRLRHAVFLGLREDKPAGEVTRDNGEETPMPDSSPEPEKGRIVVARPPKTASTEIDGIAMSHPER